MRQRRSDQIPEMSFWHFTARGGRLGHRVCGGGGGGARGKILPPEKPSDLSSAPRFPGAPGGGRTLRPT